MKIIIDTNILISAILKNRTPEEVVFNIIINPAYQWFASPEIIAEYKKGTTINSNIGLLRNCW